MKYRKTFVEVDLDAIRHNLKEHKKFLPHGASMMAVVKADGYGHGSIPVLRAALEEGADWAGVALVEEAITLREAGFNLPILLLGGWSPDVIPAFIQYGITPSVFSPQSADELNRYAKQQGVEIKVHLKVDTGMGRLGLWKQQLIEFLASPEKYENLVIDGVFSHLSSADEDSDFTSDQLRRFEELIQQVKQYANPSWVHIANSAGIIRIDEAMGNLFRLGISLYGQPSAVTLPENYRLREAISWKSQIVQIKQHPVNSPISYGKTFRTKRSSLIATVCTGYADGFSRHLSNRGFVLVRGRRAPVVGRVCMDMFMIDVTDIPDAALFDEVVIIGKQLNDTISATEMADWLGTINYEITCGISKRVPRVYV